MKNFRIFPAKCLNERTFDPTWIGSKYRSEEDRCTGDYTSGNAGWRAGVSGFLLGDRRSVRAVFRPVSVHRRGEAFAYRGEYVWTVPVPLVRFRATPNKRVTVSLDGTNETKRYFQKPLFTR